ncbi:hypothetical protein PT300_08170 [Enterobacteriaceae bacterium ESL0689]|nr:hypothetical protein [Enterobacteriaceae bacterium ESL0689]
MLLKCACAGGMPGYSGSVSGAKKRVGKKMVVLKIHQRKYSSLAGCAAGKVVVDNNNLGSAAGSGLGFWLGKTPDCDAACKADIAEGNLVVSAGVATVAGGAVIVGATPEITAEAVTPGGIGATGAIGVGKTAAEAAAAKAEATAVSAAKNGGRGTSVSSGAENIATYPKLKDELIQQNLNNIAKHDPRLEIAIKGDGSGKIDFSMGKGSRAEADRLGQIWLGEGAKQTSGGGWISADGTRGYRSPFAATGIQANFETYKINPMGKPVKVGNGHLNILD